MRHCIQRLFRFFTLTKGQTGRKTNNITTFTVSKRGPGLRSVQGVRDKNLSEVEPEVSFTNFVIQSKIIEFRYRHPTTMGEFHGRTLWVPTVVVNDKRGRLWISILGTEGRRRPPVPGVKVFVVLCWVYLNCTWLWRKTKDIEKWRGWTGSRIGVKRKFVGSRDLLRIASQVRREKGWRHRVMTTLGRNGDHRPEQKLSSLSERSRGIETRLWLSNITSYLNKHEFTPRKGQTTK